LRFKNIVLICLVFSVCFASSAFTGLEPSMAALGAALWPLLVKIGILSIRRVVALLAHRSIARPNYL